jgi:hypothetical protein
MPNQPPTTDFSAADAALGYLYQIRLALLSALERVSRDETFAAYLETLDDVVFETDGSPAELLQLKHHRGRVANLTDASPDFWKSLRVWMEGRGAGRIPEDAQLYLVTTGPVGVNSAAALLGEHGRDEAAALQRLECTVATSVNETNQPAYDCFRALCGDGRRALVASVTVLPGSPDITAAGDRLRQHARLMVRRDHVEPFLSRLEGWWYRRAVEQRAPEAGRTTTSDAYYLVGKGVPIPDNDDLSVTANIDSVVERMGAVVGITLNIHDPPAGQTREPLSANLRHALAYVFQPDNEIDQRGFLFHSQGDHWVAQAIKDTLPFFLGAIEDDHLAASAKLKELRRQLRQRERALAQAENMAGDGLGGAAALLAEARNTGIVPPDESPRLGRSGGGAEAGRGRLAGVEGCRRRGAPFARGARPAERRTWPAASKAAAADRRLGCDASAAGRSGRVRRRGSGAGIEAGELESLCRRRRASLPAVRPADG